MPQDWNYGTDRLGDATIVTGGRGFEAYRLVSTVAPFPAGKSVYPFRGAAVSLLCMRFTGRPMLLAIVGVALLCHGCSRVETRAEPIKNLAEIPAPNPQLYVHVQDYEHWRNPFLVVLSDGIRVHCLAPAFEKKVPVGALHQTLLSLDRKSV